MSIELGFARWQISDDFEVDLIDVPGHEKFVGTMTSGASGIEAAILVISVEDGIMPQTGASPSSRVFGRSIFNSGPLQMRLSRCRNHRVAT